MNYMLNVAKIFFLLIKFWTQSKKQKLFLSKFLHSFDSKLNKSDLDRLKTYGLYVPIFIGESYSSLRGSKLNTNERTAITCLGGMTALFDDLFDETNYSDDFIRNVLENPVKNKSYSPQLNLLVELYYLFLENSNHKSSTKVLMNKVFHAQVASRNQTKPTLSQTELETITYNKGGYTMQLYRRAFENDISENEDALFYQLGAIGQLENDIFDVYKDYKAGIKTLATMAIEMKQLERIYQNLHSEIWNKIDKTTFKSKNKEHFKLICSLIISRGYVALSQFKKLSKKTNQIFKTTEYSRKELICDMEKPLNRVKLLHYAASCSKK